MAMVNKLWLRLTMVRALHLKHSDVTTGHLQESQNHCTSNPPPSISTGHSAPALAQNVGPIGEDEQNHPKWKELLRYDMVNYVFI